jgi:hypothetical protein
MLVGKYEDKTPPWETFLVLGMSLIRPNSSTVVVIAIRLKKIVNGVAHATKLLLRDPSRVTLSVR